MKEWISILNPNNKMTELILNPSENAAQLNARIASAPDQLHVLFQPGDYDLDRPIEIIGKCGWTVSGPGAVFHTYYDRTNGGNPNTKSIDGFHITDCKDLVLRQLKVKSALQTNLCGTLMAIEDRTAVIRLDDGQRLDDGDRIVSCLLYDQKLRTRRFMMFDKTNDPEAEKYRYDRIMIAGEVIATNPPAQPLPWERIDDQTYRFFNITPTDPCHVGDRAALSYSYYGIVAFVFRSCENVLMEDIEIPNYGGMGVVVLPRSRDFTFRRLTFMSEDKTQHIESLQSDGLHIVGLSGKLLIEDSIFDSLSDDPLNIHTQINTVTQVCGDEVKVIYNKVKGVVYTHWAQPGDTLRILDPQSYQVKGRAAVRAFDDVTKTLTVCDADCAIRVGDWIVNDFYFADVEIRGCRLMSRGGFKLRSVSRAWVHENEIVGTFSAIHVSLGLNTLEGAPASNVLIENNVFRDAGPDCERQIYAGLYTRDDGKTRHLQHGLTIRNNRFIRNECRIAQIICYSTDGLTIEGNTYENCTHPGCFVERCDDVKIGGNTIIKE